METIIFCVSYLERKENIMRIIYTVRTSNIKEHFQYKFHENSSKFRFQWYHFKLVYFKAIQKVVPWVLISIRRREITDTLDLLIALL